MASDQRVPPVADPAAEAASAAAEQMLAATEKLRAKLPMMQGEGEGSSAVPTVPAQPAGA